MLGIARFGWLRRLDQRRTAVLMGGLVILVPFAVAIAIGLERSNLPDSYDDWTTGQKIVGMAPAFLADTVKDKIGTAGAVILAVLGLSALTVSTIGWQPLERLWRSESAAMRDKRVYEASFSDAALAESSPLPPARLKAPLLAKRKRPPQSPPVAESFSDCLSFQYL